MMRSYPLAMLGLLSVLSLVTGTPWQQAVRWHSATPTQEDTQQSGIKAPERLVLPQPLASERLASTARALFAHPQPQHVQMQGLQLGWQPQRPREHPRRRLLRWQQLKLEGG